MKLLAATPEVHLRAILLAALIEEGLGPRAAPPVVVGGAAAGFYLAGAYQSADLDLVHANREAIGRLLQRWGFEPEGRHWFHPDVRLYVEVPGGQLAGDVKRVTRVTVGKHAAHVIGVEDLIADRIAASVYWRSKEAESQATELMAVHDRRIDWSYLIERVKTLNGPALERALRRYRQGAKRLRGSRHLP